MKNLVITISGMHCSSCSLRIDGDLEELEGVHTSQTNFVKGKTEVNFDEQKVSEEAIKKVIETAGYQVVSISI